MKGWRRVMKWLVVIAICALLALQFVRPARTNPAVDQSQTIQTHLQVPPNVGAILDRACQDCHSNTTRWPWYSNVAPVSWLIQSDVDSGREHLNFSEWNRAQEVDLEEIAESIGEGSMPPWYYLPLHADAKLTQAEKDALIAGLQATLRASPPGG